MADLLTRTELDRMRIETPAELPIQIGCLQHPGTGNTVIYEDGCLRLLCKMCGFETAKVKVADR